MASVTDFECQQDEDTGESGYLTANPPDAENPREYSKIARLLVALEFIARHRYGVTIPMLDEHLRDNFGTTYRTTYRDAAKLVACQFVFADRSQGFAVLTINRSKVIPQLVGRGHSE